MANDKIICKCYKVTEKDIKKAIKKGAELAKDITGAYDKTDLTPIQS